jgi:hypothetical protein
MPVPPWTTWSFVTTSPRRSMTNPEPSAPTRFFSGGVNSVGGTFSVCVDVIETTAGAARR